MSEMSINTASDAEGAMAQPQLREVPAVRMEAVYKHYGDFTALNEVDLKVAKGEKIVVCGPRARASRRSFAASTTSRSTTRA